MKLLNICSLELCFKFDNSRPRGQPADSSPYYRPIDRNANWRVDDYSTFIWAVYQTQSSIQRICWCNV